MPQVTARRAARPAVLTGRAAQAVVPTGTDSVRLQFAGKSLALTNLEKLFWPEAGITKGDLLRYYVRISGVLLPHLRDRAMVMKRYPDGIRGPFFFMKRTPEHAPDWVKTCAITHTSGSVIEYPLVQDLPSLLWVVNLGCIDLNPWYSRCDDVDRPDFLHFDLDPVEGRVKVPFRKVLDTALVVRDALAALGLRSHAKTTGSRGIHLYVAIERGPTQKEVWTVAKWLAHKLAQLEPALITAEYRLARRPAGHVLVDYNQNAWGRTLASVYSVRPRPRASVSTPVTWNEVEQGIRLEDLRLDNVPDRVRRLGDLWKPLLQKRGRFRLQQLLQGIEREKS